MLFDGEEAGEGEPGGRHKVTAVVTAVGLGRTNEDDHDFPD